MNYIIDKENRRIIIEALTLDLEREPIIINEFDTLKKKFLQGTQDKYNCELVLLEVDIYDEDGNFIGIETKAFARRIGIEHWLMNFNLEDYSI